MGAKRRKLRKQSNTSAHYQRQLKRTTFFLDRSFGGKLILEKLRDAGFKVESHHVRFRHNTEDPVWLEVAGEKKWIVFTRDKMIGRRLLELDALLYAGVKAFVLVTDDLKDAENAKIIIASIDKILDMISENRGAFIAKIRKDDVVLWKTKPLIHRGVHTKARKK